MYPTIDVCFADIDGSIVPASNLSQAYVYFYHRSLQASTEPPDIHAPLPQLIDLLAV